jgi:hypothetical protein
MLWKVEVDSSQEMNDSFRLLVFRTIVKEVFSEVCHVAHTLWRIVSNTTRSNN